MRHTMLLFAVGYAGTAALVAVYYALVLAS